MKKYSKIGSLIGLIIGLIMTGILSVSYLGVLGSGGAVLVILIPYLIPFSITMLLLDNPSCSLKTSTDCTVEIIIGMVVTTIIFVLVGYLIGLSIDKIKVRKQID